MKSARRSLLLAATLLATVASQAAADPVSYGRPGYQLIVANGTSLPRRSAVRYLGVGFSCADNAGLLSTDCTFTGAAGSVTINSTGPLSGGGTVALGGTLTLSCSACVTSVTASGPLSSSGGTTPNISLTGIVGVAHGGTGISSAGGVTNRVLYTADGSSFTVGALPNAALANSSVTVTAGAGLSGGGSVALGSSVTLSNAGVTGCTSGGGITCSAGTGSVTLGSSAGGDLSGNVGSATVTGLQGHSVSNSLPGDGNFLIWNNGTANWTPTAISLSTSSPLSGGGVVSSGLTLSCPTCVTSVTASSPLSSSGGTTPNLTLGTVGVTKGGTGLISAGGTANRALYTADGSTFTVGALPNAALANSSLTVTAGTGLSGGGAVSLGGSTTLSLSTPVTVANGGTGLATAGGTANRALYTSDGSTLTTGQLPNAALANSAITLNNGTCTTGGGAVSLGGSVTHGVDVTCSPTWSGTHTFSGQIIAKQYTGTQSSQTTSGAVTISPTSGNMQQILANGNITSITLSLSGASVGGPLFLTFVQDGAGASGWPNTIGNALLAGGTFTKTTTANAVDFLMCAFSSALNKYICPAISNFH